MNEGVKRNSIRFTEDFVFLLSESEKQQVAANCDHLRKLRFSPTRAKKNPQITVPGKLRS